MTARRIDASAEVGLVGRNLIILLLVTLVIGLAAVEGGSILFTQLKLQDTADAAASAASSAYTPSHSVQAARSAAIGAMQESDDGAHLVKLVVDAKSDRVLGCHMLGADAPEIIQGLAIAVKCGASKRMFDQTVGIHPSAAEEFVTMREKFVRPQKQAAD